MQTSGTVGVGADTRQDDAIGRTDPLGVRRQFDVGRDAGLARGPLERLGGRAQIA
jgi:hypothetical protein